MTYLLTMPTRFLVIYFFPSRLLSLEAIIRR